MDKELKEICEEAKKESAKERCALHVEKVSDGYRISEWYNCDKTVASFEDGRQTF